MRIRLTDAILERVVETIGAKPPETGGILLGPQHRPFLTHFFFDEDAPPSSVVYNPSTPVAERAKRAEVSNRGLAYKGVVHSHPGTLNDPSPTDIDTLFRGLQQNPHLPYLVAPILVQHGDREMFPHEIGVATSETDTLFLAFHFLACGPNYISRPEKAIPEVMPVYRFLKRMDANVDLRSIAETGIYQYQTGNISWKCCLGAREYLVSFPDAFPFVSPMVSEWRNDAEDADVEIRSYYLPIREWQSLPDLESCADALSNILRGGELAFGPHPFLPLTQEKRIASLNLWNSNIITTKQLVEGNQELLYKSLFARGFGICNREDIEGKTVLILGLGSVGSEVARGLARAGVNSFVLIDGDKIEPDNLCRGIFEVADVGSFKVDAAIRAITSISPASKIIRSAENLSLPSKEDREDLLDVVKGVDLVIATTDDIQAQMLIADLAFEAGRPSLFVGVFAGALAGEIIWVIPGETACFACATAYRNSFAAQVAGTRDYGSGRLVAQPAVTADIMLTVQLGIKTGLSLLLRDGKAPLGRWLDPLREATLSRGLVRLSDFQDPYFDTELPTKPDQNGLAIRWFPVESRCPFCENTLA